MMEDFNLEKSTASFDKQKAMKEVEEQKQQFLKEKEQAVLAAADLVNVRLSDERRHSYSGKPTDISSVGIDLESSYNPSKSLYDTLSCETFERITAEQTPMDKKTRQKNLEDQRKLDAETFGVPQYNSRYRGKNPRQNNNSNNNSKRQQHNNNPKDNTSHNPSSHNPNPSTPTTTNTSSPPSSHQNTGHTSNKPQNTYSGVPNRNQNKKYAQKVFRPVQRDVSTNEENQGESGTTSQVKE
jgi:hypothetical protein